MRFHCQVEVFNRLCASAGQVQSRRQKCTLTVGGYGSSKFGGNLWILHQTASNGAGVRYKVNANIIGLFAKFVNEGKLTIRFREPAVDLRIMSDPKHLTEFVEILRNFCIGKPQSLTKKIKITDLETVPKKIEPAPLKKLLIRTPKEFSSVGRTYPSTLEHLQITNVELDHFDPKILRLQYLKTLNLEGNNVSRVPKSIELLSGLRTLILAKNKMGLSVKEEHWEWLRCESLHASLQVLDLSDNEISAIPNCLFQLRSLKSLTLSRNKLSRIPNNIGFIRNLKTLLLNHNALTWLPVSITISKFDSLDISDNMFSAPPTSSQGESQGISLKDLAAQVVLLHRLKYNDVPRELIRYLESSCFCICGKATFPEYPTHFHRPLVGNLANSVVYSEDYVNVGYRKCLFKCRR